MPNLPLTRRTTLASGAALGVAALLVTGCSDTSARKARRQAATDSRLRTKAAQEGRALLTRYDATIAAHPALRERLTPLRVQVARHLAALSTSESSPAAGGPSPSSGGGRAAAPEVPGEEKAARAALADGERRTADSRAGALLEASPTLARLLASLAGAGAAHAFLLGEDD
ncbi:hypothetical protein ACFV3R_04920 [Streptomyces sp. NPDC059740]|uniref:hypothetical protein n=1 Tax=Streptomyces sp. NPDC059740 TaxID=3346926 RepID=UPI003654C3E4